MKDIAAVIVTYNRKELLLECITALQNQSCADRLDIVVVDNASNDGTEEAIGKLQSKNLHYLRMNSNLGGAAGFHRGIKYVAEHQYEFIWIMDDDCIPKKDALEHFLDFDSRNERYGFLCSKVEWTDGSIHRMNIQRETLLKPVKNFNRKEINVTMSSFVSLFIPSRVVWELGLPIKEFFIWSDDWEFTRRISKKYPCYLLTESVVCHKTKANLGADVSKDSLDRLPRYRYLFRNDVYLYRRESLLGFSYESARLIKHSIASIRSKEHVAQKLKYIWGGSLSGLSFKPKVEYPQSKRKLRVLEAMGEPISFGGEEILLSSILSNMDMTDLSVDVLTPYYCDNESIRRLFKSWGVNLYELKLDFRPGKNRLHVKHAIRKFLSMKDYDVIHIHSGSISMLSIYSQLARKTGIPRIIVHAHCAGRKNIKHDIARMLMNRSLKEYPDVYLACSEGAARWMIPKDRISQTTVVKNGIEWERFCFDANVREAVRRRLKIEDDCFVIGCVGRLCDSKNQRFLIHILSKLKQCAEGKYKLLLVGDGELRSSLEEYAVELGADDYCIFVGATDRPEDYYQAMDLFALPSWYEGFSLVVLESQASGLPTIASDCIDRSIDVSGLSVFLSIEDEGKWISEIQKFAEKNVDERLSARNNLVVKDKSYSAKELSDRIKAIYLNR